MAVFIYEYYLKIYDRFGNVTSKPIDLPNNMYWDSLIINRVMPKDNELEITILDATDAKRIPGSPIYNESRDFDISYIDPALYPSI